MSTATLEPRVHAQRNYLNADYGWKSWLFTLDHKRIALLYMVSVTFFFIIGGSFAVLMRIHLVEPQGALVQPETYNKLFTLHGVVMIFFFLIPSIPAVLGNFLVPLMVGARDLAFPRLNLLSWYIYIVGGLFTLYSAIAGGVDTGILRRQRRSAAWLELGDGARRGVGVGGTARSVRQASVSAAVRTRN